MAEPTIIVVTKAPDPLRSKTRLAPLPAPLRRDISAAMIEDTLTLALSMTGSEVVVACDPGPEHPFFQRMKALGDLTLVPQPSGDLGARLSALLERYATEGQGCIFLGSDCPHLPPEILRDALETCKAPSPWDGVMAPALDGGYVLIGLKAQGAELLRDIPWSTAEVASATRLRADAAKLQLKELPQNFDIDEPEDLRRLLDSGDAGSAPRTRAVLGRSLALLLEAR